MSTKVDQKAYLQKYLTGISADKKKKKKKAVTGKGFKIIDDDIDLSKLRPLDGDELDILDDGEDAPQIAGIIDERPEELRKLEQFQTSSKWRIVNQDDGFNSKLEIEEIKSNFKETVKENEMIFGKMYSDSEEENKKDSDQSPPRNSLNDPQKTVSKSKKHDSDSDFSPPRKRDDRSPKRQNNNRTDDTNSSQARPEKSKERGRKQSRWGDWSPEPEPPSKEQTHSPKNFKRDRSKSPSSDISPPRKSKKNKHSNESPPRKSKKNYSSDASPPRKYKRYVPDSPPHTSRNIHSDLGHNKSAQDRSRPDFHKGHKGSPQKHNHYDHNQSNSSKYDTSRKQRVVDDPPSKDSQSLDRKTRRHSPEKNKKRKYNTHSDQSPPRRDRDGNNPVKSRNNQHTNDNSDSDQSPPRRNRDNNTAKGRNDYKQMKHDSDSDQSPPRRKRDSDKSRNQNNKRRQESDSDQSPPRRERYRDDDRQSNSNKRSNDSPPPSNKKMAKTLDGKAAGLQDARQLRQENADFRRREDEVFNKMTDEVTGRNAQVVSRKGKRETSEDRQKQREKAVRQMELDEKYKKWSAGVKQLQDREERVQDFLHEASKPLARLRDDKDLEHTLKRVERDGDPMLQYMRERKRERGELGPERPMYKGSFPPNRFNIRPGYRWDGVDRSNGYEKKYFETQSKKKAQEEEAYKWSTEDL